MHPEEECDTLMQVLAPLTKISMIVDVEDLPEGKFLAFIRSQSQWKVLLPPEEHSLFV